MQRVARFAVLRVFLAGAQNVQHADECRSSGALEHLLSLGVETSTRAENGRQIRSLHFRGKRWLGKPGDISRIREIENLDTQPLVPTMPLEVGTLLLDGQGHDPLKELFRLSTI